MIGDRIKEIRKEFHLTQEEFGKRINMTRGNICNLEAERYQVTDRVLSDICREFNINIEWLRDGVGEMRAKSQGNEQVLEFAGLALPDDLDPVRIGLINLNIKLITSLPDELLAEIIPYFKDIVDSAK